MDIFVVSLAVGLGFFFAKKSFDFLYCDLDGLPTKRRIIVYFLRAFILLLETYWFYQTSISIG